MHYCHYMDTESQAEPTAVYVALDDEAWPLQALFGVKMANTHAWLLAQQQPKRESPTPRVTRSLHARVCVQYASGEY